MPNKPIAQCLIFQNKKNKLTSKYFENLIPKIYSNENPTKNDPNNKKQISKITVDSFIGKLVEFEEIVTSKGNDFLSTQQVYHVSLNLEIYHQLN